MKIVVLMSTYNGEKFLREQINSVLAQDIQTVSKLQLIVRDDGSTDHTVEILDEYQSKNKLMWYSGEFHQTEVQAVWGNTILTNVHNEWLNMLINYGVFGAITYISIFITCIVRTVKNWKEKPILLAFGASVIAYMGHNFFCFQQVVCTSLIFIVIAMAEGDIVKLKKDR